MNVKFEIKLNDINNKNFLVFTSTELAKKLKYELIGTDRLNWTFKKGEEVLDISIGYIKKELIREKDNRGYNRYETREVETLVKDILVINFINADSMDTVNFVFNIINKYANLKINENEEDNKEDELVEMLNSEVACDEE